MFISEHKAAARDRVARIMFAIFNIQEEMEWHEIEAALIAVANANECYIRDFETMDAIVTENCADWSDAFDKWFNNVAMGKSYPKFASHITKFFDFSNPK